MEKNKRNRDKINMCSTQPNPTIFSHHSVPTFQEITIFLFDFVLTIACIVAEISSYTDRSATNETLQSTALLVIPSILCCILVVYLKAVLIHEVIWLFRWPGCPVSEIPIISINPPPFPFVLLVCSSNPEERIAVILVDFWLYVVVDFHVCDGGEMPIVFVAELFSIQPRLLHRLPQVAIVFHLLPVVGTCWWNALVEVFSFDALKGDKNEIEMGQHNQPHLSKVDQILITPSCMSQLWQIVVSQPSLDNKYSNWSTTKLTPVAALRKQDYSCRSILNLKES